MMDQETLVRDSQPAPGPDHAPPPSTSPQPGYWPAPAYPPYSYPPMVAPPRRRGPFVLVVVLLVAFMLFFAGILFLALILAFNVGGIVAAGPIQTVTQSIPVGSASSATVNLDVGTADLTLTGGASNLMDASFQFNNEQWRPSVNYTTTGTEGTLDVRQTHTQMAFAAHNTWQLHLSNAIPLDVHLHQGVGNTTAYLAGLKMTNLTVDMGVGNAQIDLTGMVPQSLAVTIQGGVGNCTVVLPKDVGVRVVVDNGLGRLTMHGLQGSGNVYTNAAYGKTPTTIDVNLKVGLGNVTVN